MRLIYLVTHPFQTIRRAWWLLVLIALRLRILVLDARCALLDFRVELNENRIERMNKRIGRLDKRSWQLLAKLNEIQARRE